MPILSVQSLSKTFDESPIIDGISFHIQKGQKVALVAKNGSGKTTLIRIIAGLETADTGEMLLDKDIQTAFVFQHLDYDPGMQIEAAIFTSDNPALKAIADYEKALLSNNTQDLQSSYQAIDTLNAWDYHVRVKQVLNQLKLDQLTQKVAQLSGGQKRRISLAKALIEEPDFIVLDEPTNHLDLEMIEWLEHYLTHRPITLLMVTHDRYFLERICDEIFELDQGQLYCYAGNYSYYLEKKAARLQEAKKSLASAKNLYKKELQWIRKQPRARGTKSRARVEAFEDISQKAHQQLESDSMSFDFKVSRLGGKILELQDVSKAFPNLPLFKDFNYTFNKGDRIGIIGKNGTGKTTFLNTIMGLEALDSGQIEAGETVRFGYYRQSNIELDFSQRLIDIVRDVAEYLPLTNGKTLSASQLLERFLFPAAMQYRQATHLSGGEKKRLYLLTVLMTNPNFLILDEPTNDLDIDTIQVLEEFLSEFPGCLLVVSHDRYFMDKMVNHLFVFQDGDIQYFSGSYTRYWEEQAEAEQEAKAVKSSKKQERPKSKPQKLSFKQKQEKLKLEQAMEKLGQHKEALETQMSQTQDYEALQQLAKEHQDTQDQLDETEMAWLELAELEEALQAD